MIFRTGHQYIHRDTLDIALEVLSGIFNLEAGPMFKARIFNRHNGIVYEDIWVKLKTEDLPNWRSL